MLNPANDLSHLRCFNHPEREAAARCLECRNYFCRECVTEHEDRLLCAVCVRQLGRRPLFKRPVFAGVLRGLQCLAGLLLAWFFFYMLAELLLRVPSSFHEGTLWQ